MYKIKIGDLVCYNSGGMKHKTLGVVMDLDLSTKRRWNTRSHRDPKSVLIMWSVVGKFMPRQCWVLQRDRRPIESGDMIWHEYGDWFVEVK